MARSAAAESEKCRKPRMQGDRMDGHMRFRNEGFRVIATPAGEAAAVFETGDGLGSGHEGGGDGLTAAMFCRPSPVRRRLRSPRKTSWSPQGTRVWMPHRRAALAKVAHRAWPSRDRCGGRARFYGCARFRPRPWRPLPGGIDVRTMTSGALTFGWLASSLAPSRKAGRVPVAIDRSHHLGEPCAAWDIWRKRPRAVSA